MRARSQRDSRAGTVITLLTVYLDQALPRIILSTDPGISPDTVECDPKTLWVGGGGKGETEKSIYRS